MTRGSLSCTNYEKLQVQVTLKCLFPSKKNPNCSHWCSIRLRSSTADTVVLCAQPARQAGLGGRYSDHRRSLWAKSLRQDPGWWCGPGRSLHPDTVSCSVPSKWQSRHPLPTVLPTSCARHRAWHRASI